MFLGPVFGGWDIGNISKKVSMSIPVLGKSLWIITPDPFKKYTNLQHSNPNIWLQTVTPSALWSADFVNCNHCAILHVSSYPTCSFNCWRLGVITKAPLPFGLFSTAILKDLFKIPSVPKSLDVYPPRHCRFPCNGKCDIYYWRPSRSAKGGHISSVLCLELQMSQALFLLLSSCICFPIQLTKH